jgi:hypothetical protein
MGRSVRVAILGWSSGFVVALLIGANRVSNPHARSALLVAALVGLALMAVLMVSVAVADHVERRRWAEEEALDDEETLDEFVHLTARALPTTSLPLLDERASAVAAAAERTAATIAALEARLAVEQEELDAALEAMAAADLLGSAHAFTASTYEEVAIDAAAAEPVLRQQLLDTLVELVGRGEHRSSDDLAREFELLLQHTA